MDPETIIRVVIFTSIFIGLFTLAFYILGFLGRRKKPAMPKKLYNVSVVIPAYNEQAALEKTVDSVVALDYPKNKLEIVIVDDGSKDATPEIGKMLEKKYSNVKYYRKKNGGKGSALNYGIAKSNGEIVVSFDADSMIVPGALQEMLPYFQDEKVMCVTPIIKVWKPKGILQRMQAIEYDLGIFLRKAFSMTNAIHVTPGPFSAYRKEFFEKYGGYDEHNITEDMEIAMRIQSLHYRIENAPKAIAYTIAPRKLIPLTIQRRRWYFGMVKNLWAYRRMFSLKYGELGIVILPLSIFSILSMMTVTFYYIGKGIVDWTHDLNLYSAIGFDFLHNWEYRWDLMGLSIYRSMSEGIIMFALFFMVFTLCMLFFVNRRVKSIDRPISTFISYIWFTIFYSISFSVWWVISLVYAATRKQVSWR